MSTHAARRVKCESNVFTSETGICDGVTGTTLFYRYQHNLLHVQGGVDTCHDGGGSGSRADEGKSNGNEDLTEQHLEMRARE